MPAPKGTMPPGAGKGRPKGVPNKVTKTVREAFQAAFEELQKRKGLGVALDEWAEMNPTEFYKLAAKLIPITNVLTGRNGGPVQMQVDARDLPDDALNARIKELLANDSTS